MIIWKGRWRIDKDEYVKYRVCLINHRFYVELGKADDWQAMRDVATNKELNMSDWHGLTRNVDNLEILP